MRNHSEAIEALGFEFDPKRGTWKNPRYTGIMVRFKGAEQTTITSKVGTATLSGSVPAEAVNQLVASMLRELDRVEQS